MLEYFRMIRDWESDLVYSELVYSFILRRERRAKTIWEDIIEKGPLGGRGWNAQDTFLLKGLQQWVSLSYHLSI